MEPMRYGTINCVCGQQFAFETVRVKVNCIKCSKEYDVSDYPAKEEIQVIEEVAEEGE